jgi:hypothetical protein
MRAHSLRRGLWILNVLLGAAVVGLAAWLVLVVRPATADTGRTKAEFATKAFDEYKRRPNAARVENAPVSQEQVKSIDKPDYQKLNYWIFSGPVPPEPRPDTGPVEAAPQPTGLETIGKPAFIIFMEPDPGQSVASDTVVAWQFNDKKLGFFKPGKFIRQSGQPERFLLVDVREVEPSVHEIVYDVHDDPKAPPVKTAQLLKHDARRKETGGPIRPVPTPGAPAAPGEGAPGEGTPLAPGGDGAKPGVVAGTPPAPIAPEPARPEPRFEEIQPEIRRIGSDRIEVDFDQATYDFVRGKSVESFAEKVKTTPATDPRTGKALGLRITGIDAQSPAQKFDVKAGDIVVSINGQPVRDRDEIIAIVQRMPPDTSRVTVGIDRNGRLITYTIDPRDPKTRRAGRNLIPR